MRLNGVAVVSVGAAGRTHAAGTSHRALGPTATSGVLWGEPVERLTGAP
ncbi:MULTISPECIES: hypothetical protein [Streptomyces]|nr:MULTISPECIES: hypothetical protein [Streptomyces]